MPVFKKIAIRIQSFLARRKVRKKEKKLAEIKPIEEKKRALLERIKAEADPEKRKALEDEFNRLFGKKKKP